MTEQTATKYEALTAAISAWLASQRSMAGADRFVLGLSGGVDSATVCGLCARAAGPDRVVGVIMPSHSNPEDASHAAETAAAFGVETITVDLSATTDSLLSAIQTGLDVSEASASRTNATDRRRQLAAGNTRPRIRMTTLYYVANLLNGIVVGTGNRSEAAIGYFTKYGDGGVDLLPIVNLYKFEVREVARILGVPPAIITKAPSAGLWPGQTDEAEIGLSYAALDAALVAIAAGNEASVAPAVRDRITGLATISAHKRAPMPAYVRES